MHRVVLTGWEYGLKKVSLDKLLSEQGQMSLRDAFEAVNGLLAGKPVVIEFESQEAAARLLAEARRLGAVGELSTTP